MSSPSFCGTSGYPSPDGSIRLYSRAECSSLLGKFNTNGECLNFNGGSFSWDCRNLNNGAAQPTQPAMQPNDIAGLFSSTQFTNQIAANLGNMNSAYKDVIVQPYTPSTTPSSKCGTYGYPSPDGKIRLYSQAECNSLRGNFVLGGECLSPNGGSISWDCRNLNTGAAQTSQVAPQPSQVAPQPSQVDPQPSQVDPQTLSVCGTSGYPSPDGTIRLYSQAECNSLGGKFNGDGQCLHPNGGSFSWDCRKLNPTGTSATCGTYGYESQDGRNVRLYSQAECSSLGGSFRANGECLRPNGGSFSWDCRILNNGPQASRVSVQPSPVSVQPSPVSLQPSPVSLQPSPVSLQPITQPIPQASWVGGYIREQTIPVPLQPTPVPVQPYTPSTTPSSRCGTSGYASPDGNIRLYSQAECSSLGGQFNINGECLNPNGGSFSWDCRNLNTATVQPSPVSVQPSPVPVQPTPATLQSSIQYFCPEGWKQTNTDINNGTCTLAGCASSSSFNFGPKNGGYPVNRRSAYDFCVDLRNGNDQSKTFTSMSPVWPAVAAVAPAAPVAAAPAVAAAVAPAVAAAVAPAVAAAVAPAAVASSQQQALFCGTSGHASPDGKIRLYSQAECTSLGGNFHDNGECTHPNGGSFSWDCRKLNTAPVQPEIMQSRTQPKNALQNSANIAFTQANIPGLNTLNGMPRMQSVDSTAMQYATPRKGLLSQTQVDLSNYDARVAECAGKSFSDIQKMNRNNNITSTETSCGWIQNTNSDTASGFGILGINEQPIGPMPASVSAGAKYFSPLLTKSTKSISSNWTNAISCVGAGSTASCIKQGFQDMTPVESVKFASANSSYSTEYLPFVQQPSRTPLSRDRFIQVDTNSGTMVATLYQESQKSLTKPSLQTKTSYSLFNKAMNNTNTDSEAWDAAFKTNQPVGNDTLPRPSRDIPVLYGNIEEHDFCQDINEQTILSEDTIGCLQREWLKRGGSINDAKYPTTSLIGTCYGRLKKTK